jgi:hypothetical protein
MKIKILIVSIFIMFFLVGNLFFNYLSIRNAYFLSVLLLGLSLFIYPINFKFQEKKDFIFIPILTVAAFNLLNILFLSIFNHELTFTNLLFSLFCSFQFLNYSKVKR